MRECKAAMCPPKRLRISELNPHLLCALCGGYLIDATTIIECLHSFCKTCILSYLGTSNYCPICEVLIHKTRPWQNIRLDHALQNAVYKMVPGLFQNEMKRRREFYQQHHLPDKYGQIVGHSQGQTGDRIIFSQDEEFSVSIEFSPDGKPVTETKTKQLKRPSDTRQHDKRYLKCPAGLRVEHLKKFIRLKFTLPQHIEIDLFYESEPLYDSFSLMDIAYIYLWKRDCVLQLFYSFFEVPTKKSKLQSIIHISEIVSKSKKIFDKPQKNFGDRKSSNKKEKSDSKKQSRISGKKKGTVKTLTSSTSPVCNAPHEDIIVAKGAVSSSLKRKHPESSASKDSSCLSRSRTTTVDTSACSKIVKRVDNLAPVECSSVHAACQPVSTQSPASSDRSVSPQLCRESTNCSIISHHSTERTTCSVTSHFCTDNTQCSIVTHPCVTHSNRNSKSPADSEVSITLLIKSSESNDYQHITQSSPRCTPGRLQNGENTSEITYNTFLNGDTLSEIKGKSGLAGGKFLKVKNTFLKKSKKESKVTEMNIQNGELVSEVQVKVNGKIAPELTNKQLVNGQFIFRLQNGKITNGDMSSKASHRKNRCRELSVVDTKCESVGKGNEVGSIKRSRNVSCAKHSVRKASDTMFEQKDTKVNLVQCLSPVKNIQDETKDCHNVRNNCFHNGERLLGEKLDVDRISEVEDTFSNGDIVFDMKDKNVKDKKVENDNNLCDKMFEKTDVTSDFKDRKLVIVDLMDALKDEKLPKSEMDSFVKDTTLVRRGVKPTAGSFHQASSDTNHCHVKSEGTVLPVSSQIEDIGAEDMKLTAGSEKPDLNLTYGGQTRQIEDVSSQPQSTASDPDKSLEISAASQVLHSETCVDTEQVVSTTGPGDSAAAGSENTKKDLCQDTNRDNVVGLKHLMPSRPASSPVRSLASSPVSSTASSSVSSTVSLPVSSSVSTPPSSSAHVQKPFNAKSETSKRLQTQPRAPCDSDILDGQTKEAEICLRPQSPCAIGKINIQLGNTENIKTDVATCTRTKSLSNQLPSEGSSHFSDRTILILPSLCSTKPTSVDKTCNSAPETASAIKTISTEHKTWKDPAPTVVAQKVGLDSRTGDSIDELSTAIKVKKNKEECRKQRYSPEVSKDMSASGHTSGHTIEKHINFSESANKISNNVHKVNSQSVTVQAKRASAASSGKPSTNSDVSSVTSLVKPFTISDVHSVTSSATPVPLKRVPSAAASAVTSSLSPTASVFPANSNCLIVSSSGSTSSLSSTSSSSLTTPTATVKTNSCCTKSLPAKSSSPQPRMTATGAPQPRMTATVAATKTVDAVPCSSVATTSLASQNNCHSRQIEGRNDSRLGSKQTVSGSILSNPPLPQDVPPDVITSAFTPTNGSSEVASLRVSGSNSIPITSASSRNSTACVVSSFLNLPPAKTSPKKRPQPRSNPHSTKSSTDLILPSEATKLENFLFDVKSPEKELFDSYSQNRVSSSCGKETQKSLFRTKLNSELGIGMDKSPKTVESHITGVHHLPKTISQTPRPSSTARSVSTSLSPNTTYNNNIIHTTKISTLIPKSNSVSSKAGVFAKSSSYSSNVNSLLLSRNILNNSLASHYQRVDGLLAIRGASCIPQELTSKPSAISSSSSSTPSSLLSSTPSTSHHKMSSTAKQSSKGTSGRSDKSPKHRTIPPLCIPKSSLIGPTTLKLQRSPGSNDHYIFSPLLHYGPASQQKVDRTKSTESKHRTSHSHKTVLPGSKGTVTSASKQRVPSIKISDINRNPVIVENGGSGNSSNNNAHCQSPFKTYHSASKSSALENGTPRAHNRGRNEANSSAGRHDKMPVRDILRPSDSELLLSRHWHAYSTAELLFSGFSLPAHSKLHDLQYDTDAMPLDYSQSSSKS